MTDLESRDEQQVAAQLIERLLTDPDFRAKFRRNPAKACRDVGLDELADEMSLGAGKAMMTLDVRESKSSLAGVMMAAAMEGVAVYEFTKHVAPALEDLGEEIAGVLSHVNLPAVQGILSPSVGARRRRGGGARGRPGRDGRRGGRRERAGGGAAAAPAPAPTPEEAAAGAKPEAAKAAAAKAPEAPEAPETRPAGAGPGRRAPVLHRSARAGPRRRPALAGGGGRRSRPGGRPGRGHGPAGRPGRATGDRAAARRRGGAGGRRRAAGDRSQRVRPRRLRAAGSPRRPRRCWTTPRCSSTRRASPT